MRDPNWKNVSILAAAGVATALLAACGGSGSAAAPLSPPPPPPAQVPLPSQLGIGFAMKFAAMLNADPTDPAAGDIIPLSLSGDPLAVPDPM